ncbi:hypothetical protein [Larkinella knui]
MSAVGNDLFFVYYTDSRRLTESFLEVLDRMEQKPSRFWIHFGGLARWKNCGWVWFNERYPV